MPKGGHDMNDDDIQLQSYQDDLTTDDNATDPLMEEENDDPTKDLGIPADEFGAELDKEDSGSDDEITDDDEREYIEDMDEDGDDESYRT
jgi:hypothetical protein